MIRTGNYTQATNYYKNNTATKKASADKSKGTEYVQNSQHTDGKIASSEHKLSQKAKDYLEALRKNNKDFDFMVADKGDDFKGLVNQSKKEFSVVFSSEELERMASDEKYAQEKLDMIDKAVKMSDRINEQFGFERAGDKNNKTGTFLNKLTMSFDDSGEMKLFANLEQISEKQLERIENLKDKRIEEKHAEEKHIADKKKDLIYKQTTIEASSEEDLIGKISELDWSKIQEEKAVEGMKFDKSI